MKSFDQFYQIFNGHPESIGLLTKNWIFYFKIGSIKLKMGYFLLSFVIEFWNLTKKKCRYHF